MLYNIVDLQKAYFDKNQLKTLKTNLVLLYQFGAKIDKKMRKIL
jgi:hypothetical protein